jgi:hypothetical protein
MIYRFSDGSIDDETTTYRQQGTFQLVRNHHIEKGPFFAKPVDFNTPAFPPCPDSGLRYDLPAQ